jgi:katanin p60 ATPase-containing subunit A1
LEGSVDVRSSWNRYSLKQRGEGKVGTEDENAKKKLVIVLATTNTPWDLDEALRRRLEKRIYSPLPEFDGRKELSRINLKDGVKLGEDVDFNKLAEKSAGYSGADVTNVCREAAMMGVRRHMGQGRKQGFSKEQRYTLAKELKELPPVSQLDLLTALANVSRSVSENNLQRYQEWMQEFGSS